MMGQTVQNTGRQSRNINAILPSMSTMVLCTECGKYFYTSTTVVKVCERCLNNGSMRP